MATAERIEVTPEVPGVQHAGEITQALADAVNHHLRQNHVDRHCFYGKILDIFQHNHITHHQLTLFAMGDTPEHAKLMYEANNNYQVDQPKGEPAVHQNFDNEIFYLKNVGDDQQYGNFLSFFQTKIAKLGVEEVVNRYCFARDEIGEDMFVRLFMGFLHPLIHLGFGIEFKQPAIVAEALTQALSHQDDYMFGPLKQITELSKSRKDHYHLTEIFQSCTEDTELLKARTFKDGVMEYVRDGLLVYCPDRVVEYCSRWTVSPTDKDIAIKMAELENASCYAVGGCQKKGKIPQIDFLLLHLPNSAIFVSTMSKLPWLSNESKARLLSAYGQMIVLLFAGFGAGIELDDGIEVIRAVKPLDGGWEEARLRAIAHPDDGHAIKLIRSLAYAQVESRPFVGKEGFSMTEDDFLRLATATVLSLKPEGGRAAPDSGESWVRAAGTDKAWAKVPDIVSAA